MDDLVRTQIGFQQEITAIRNELNLLRSTENQPNLPPTPPTPHVKEYIPPPRVTPVPPGPAVEQPPPRETKPPNFGYPKEVKSPFEVTAAAMKQSPEKSEIEKFIGENLLSKIGIVILVIGVAIGAKYAIDKNWITPLMRIVLGYVFGFGLMGLAVKLKARYLNFSAVLMSGAMAILYFITFFAYNLYGLISQKTAFALMTMFTVFTVVAAINYSRQIIAHLGLVGAYAIPFLLSDNSGNYAVLFAYIAIINGGILAISLRKYWKPLFYTSFFFTWVIYFGWYLSLYNQSLHYNLAWTFLLVYFLIFYATFIGYKVISDENIALENVSLVLMNSFIFYGVGFSLLGTREGLESYRGLFTVGNAAIHFVVAMIISRLKLFPNDLVYLLTALIIIFATVSIPVQLDGNYVTLIWTAEAAILFWIGRTKSIALFQYFSFPLMLLAAASLFHDWLVVFIEQDMDRTAGGPFPVLNGNFVTGLFFAAACGFIFYINRDERFETFFEKGFRKQFGVVIAAVGVGVLYNCFRIEIANYFHYLAVKTAIPQPVSAGMVKLRNYDLDSFSILWQINYTMLFLSLLSLVNIRKLRSFTLGYANLFLNVFALVIFLTVGLYYLSELRGSYLSTYEPQYFARSSFHVLIRYISYAFCAGLIYACYRYIKQNFMLERLSEYSLGLAFDFVLYVALWIVSSSELINLFDIFGYRDSYKLGLSILWGVYALALIIIGIYQHKKHLRIGAIVLFGITLVKLFFYDIADLNTISKTIVFVSLGVLMLIVSFLYNKYKALIFEGQED